MKKKQLFLAATAILLASCTDTTYLGDQAAITNGSGVISFGSSSPAVTRAESYGSEAAAKLEYKFRVFGVKTMGTGTSPTDQRVFATNATGVYPYDVWFVNGSSNSTASNSSNWEYVGANGQTYGTTGHTVTLTADQTIKYWDYSATAYNFQAWSDINAADSKVNVSAIDKNTMTIRVLLLNWPTFGFQTFKQVRQLHLHLKLCSSHSVKLLPKFVLVSMRSYLAIK